MHFAWKGPNTAETNEAFDRLWRLPLAVLILPQQLSNEEIH